MRNLQRLRLDKQQDDSLKIGSQPSLLKDLKITHPRLSELSRLHDFQSSV